MCYHILMVMYFLKNEMRNICNKRYLSGCFKYNIWSTMDDENVPPVVQQTSDWCICILCAKIIGISDISHMQNPRHLDRMRKDTSGVAKYIFSIPRPLYCDTLRFYPDDYMPTPDELITSYEFYSKNQPFLYGAAVQRHASSGVAVNLQNEINEDLDRELMEFVLKESMHEHSMPQKLLSPDSMPQKLLSPDSIVLEDNIADNADDQNQQVAEINYDAARKSYSDITK